MGVEEILIRIFSAIFLSMCTGSIMFLIWMILTKIFINQVYLRVYDIIVKFILILFYIPIGYYLVNVFWRNGYVFSPTPLLKKVFYMISIIWLIGMIITILRFWKRTFRIRREKDLCFECETRVRKLFEECKRELDIQKSIELLQGYRIQSPMIAGVIKPCVFLPVKDMTEQQLKVCIYHELTHYKKNDIFWNYISCIMVCIHWYCPWVKIIFQKIDEWSEIICDSFAINYVNSMKQYFTTILDMSQNNESTKAYRTACLFENFDTLEHRMHCAMIYRKPKKIKYVVIVMMVILFFGMSVTSIYATSYSYQKLYTKLEKRTEIEIEESDDGKVKEKIYKEQIGVLKQGLRDRRKKINLKNDKVITLEDSISSRKNIRYHKILAEQNDKIEISISGEVKFRYIKVGIVDRHNKITYVEDQNVNELTHTFKIKEQGTYDIFIKTGNKKKVSIIGMIVIE